MFVPGVVIIDENMETVFMCVHTTSRLIKILILPVDKVYGGVKRKGKSIVHTSSYYTW